MRHAAVLALLFALAGCEWFGEEVQPAGPPVEPEVRERVVADVLRRLGAAYQESGPRFHVHLPEIKREAVQAAGFSNWAEFRSRLEGTDPALVVDISRRITDRMRELLSPAGG